jgi:diguanylate cyclase (GGDEF)-like protein/PAS domain S-box-containing protein
LEHVAKARELLSSAVSPDGDGWLNRLAFAAALIDDSGEILESNDLFKSAVSLGDTVRPRLSEIVQPDCLAPLIAAIAVLRTNPDSGRRVDLRLKAAGGSHRRFRAAVSVVQRLSVPSTRQLMLLEICDIEDIVAADPVPDSLGLRLSSALDGAGIGVWDVDMVRGTTTYSDTYRTMRGWDTDAPMPSTLDGVLALIHPEDRPLVARYFSRQRNGELVNSHYEFRQKHRDGHWIWIECRGTCFSSIDGKPNRIVGTDIDVTERKQAEARLTLMSRRLKLAMEVSRIGVFEADFETGLTDWDESMYRLYGVDRDSTVKIGELWESLLHPDDRDRVLSTLNDHIARRIPFDDQFRVIRADGSLLYVRSRVMPFDDAEGRLCVIGANWDETEGVVLNNDLKRAKTLAEGRARELEIAKAEIERVALLDPLTDLPNRRFLDKCLTELAATGVVENRGLAILHIDLDRFKQINDTFGHHIGDAVLKHVAMVLTREARANDRVFRIGGDEFVLLRHFDGDRDALELLATRLVEMLRRPVNIGGNDCRFGASIGIAIGDDAQSQQLLLNADIGLYHAKNRGRNRWEYFNRESRDRLLRTKQVADDILRAFERDEFVPHYQLQFDAHTFDIAGVETLARWQHPTRGLLTPDKFMPVAAELDLLTEIDRRILDKALVDCATFASAGCPMPKCSVNVSAGRLRDPQLAGMIAALPPRSCQLSFELLESIFLDDFDDQVSFNLDEIRKAGIAIEIDDFGSGHASITSLLRLRPNALKIDRELIRTLPDSAEQRSLIRSIIDMGHSLGVTVIGEGVETHDHAFWLRNLNCDLLQGYALARPMPAEAIIDYVRCEGWRP